MDANTDLTPPPPPPPPPIRTMYRSPVEKKLGGVAGGIAEYTGTDPTVVRVLFVVLALCGPGLLLYPLLWIFVPLRSMAPPAVWQPQPQVMDPAA